MSPEFSNNSSQKKSDGRRILSEFQWKKNLPINKKFKLPDHPVLMLNADYEIKLLTGSKSELQISPIRSSMVTNIRNSSYRSGELLELQNEKSFKLNYLITQYVKCRFQRWGWRPSKTLTCCGEYRGWGDHPGGWWIPQGSPWYQLN